MKTSTYLKALLVAACAATSSVAQTVLVDFGTDTSYRGLSVTGPDDNGNYWNSLTPGMFDLDLVDTDNNPTIIDLGWNTPVGTDSYNGPAGPTDSAAIFPFTLDQWCDLNCDLDQAALGNLGGSLYAGFDYAAVDTGLGPTARFVIQGLDPSSTYDLTFFATHKFSADSSTFFNVYSDETYTTLVGTTSLDVQDEAMPWLHNRDTTATISGLSPDPVNLFLYVEFGGTNGGPGYLNALEIVGVSSPGLDGDANGDGAVDILDLDILSGNFGTMGGATVATGDFNSDGNVDILDLDILSGNFGAMVASSAAVPEPTASLIFTTLVCMSGRPRRRS